MQNKKSTIVLIGIAAIVVVVMCITAYRTLVQQRYVEAEPEEIEILEEAI